MTNSQLLPPAPSDTDAPPSDPAAAEPSAEVLPAAIRGVTEISDRVVAKLAARLATEVDGVNDHEHNGLKAKLSPGAGRSTTAEATVARSTVRLAISFDVRYPQPVREVAEQVRTHVRDEVQRLTGLEATQIDITVRDLVHRSSNGRRVQ